MEKILTLTEAEQIVLGKVIADAFGLRRSREYPDRYITEYGTKTALGVYAMAKRLVIGEALP